MRERLHREHGKAIGGEAGFWNTKSDVGPAEFIHTPYISYLRRFSGGLVKLNTQARA